MISKLANLSFQGTFINKTTPQDREDIKTLAGDKGLSNVDKAVATFKKGIEKYYPAGDTVELRINKNPDYDNGLMINTSHKNENGKVSDAELEARANYVAKDDYFCTEDYEIGGVSNGKQYLESILLEAIPAVDEQTGWKLMKLGQASARLDDIKEKHQSKQTAVMQPETNITPKESILDKIKTFIHKK